LYRPRGAPGLSTCGKYRPEFGGDKRLDAVDIDVTDLRRILEQIADDGHG